MIAKLPNWKPGQPRLGLAVMPTADGRLAMENVERSFWQSRCTLAGRPVAFDEVQLTDIPELAKQIRRAA